MKHILYSLLFLLPLALISQDVMISNVEIANEFNSGTYKHEIPFQVPSDIMNVHFDYEVFDGQSYRVYIKPFTNGEATAGSGLVFNNPTISGQGTKSLSFRIDDSGDVIEEMRFRVLRASDLEMIQEFYIPCSLSSGETELSPVSISVDPEFGIMRKGMDSVFVDVFVDSDNSIEKVFVASLTGTDHFGHDFEVENLQQPFTEDGTHQVGVVVDGPTSYSVSKLTISCWTADLSTFLGSFEIEVDWNWGMVNLYNVRLDEAYAQSSTYKKLLFDYKLRPEVSLFLVQSYGVHAGYRFSDQSFDYSLNSDESGSGYTVAEFPSSFQGDSGYNITDLRMEVDIQSNPGVPTIVKDIPVDFYYGDAWVNELKFSIPTNARIDTGQVVDVLFDMRNESGPCSAGIHLEFDVDADVNSSESFLLEDNTDNLLHYWFKFESGNVSLEELDLMLFDGGQNTRIEFDYPLEYRIAENYYSVCGADAPPLAAPVGLTKSFAPVNGVVNRVQLKWYKALPSVKFNAVDAVSCDIRAWPVKDLANNVAITGPWIRFEDRTKPGRNFFKWPIMFRSDTTFNHKRVEPNTRYKWKVRCACSEGTDSEWSEIKFFNTPDFDPVTGILASEGIIGYESTEAKSLGSDEIRIYPNPTSDAIQIDNSKAGDDIKQFWILDLSGKVVREGGNLSNTVISVRMNDLADGLYYLRMLIGERVESRLIEKR